MKPLVSVQVCCYNSEKYLAQTLESVAAQTFKGWELVIVNDGSTDGTESIINSFVKKGLPITCHSQPNSGFAAARNRAVGLSKGDWIAILDHDDLWRPEKLDVQLKAAEKYPKAKLHFSNSEWFTDDGKIERNTIENGRFCTGIIKEPFTALLSEGCFIDSETALIDRVTVEALGGFNERYKYIVDYDMFLRIAKENAICYEDKVLAGWRMHPSQATKKLEEDMTREYIDLFERALKESGLPAEVKRKVKRSIVYHLNNYSLLMLKKEGKKAFLRTLLDGIKKRPMSPHTYLKTLHTFCRAYMGEDVSSR